MIRNIINFILGILPTSRLFRFKKFLVILGGYEIGKNVSFNQKVRFYGDSHVEVGDNTWVGIDCLLFSSASATISIGKRCDIGPKVSFITGTHEIGDSERRAGTEKAIDINIGDGTWIGASVTILGGANVGKGCIIAAGSVVMKNTFPDNVMIGGIPAEVIKKLD